MNSPLSRFAAAAVVIIALVAMPALAQENVNTIPRPDGKPADMTRPVHVFILLGQSNMVGLTQVIGDAEL